MFHGCFITYREFTPVSLSSMDKVLLGSYKLVKGTCGN